MHSFMEPGELHNRSQKMKVLVLSQRFDLSFFIFYCHNVTCVIEKNEFLTIHDGHQKRSEGEGLVLRKAHSSILYVRPTGSCVL